MVRLMTISLVFALGLVGCGEPEFADELLIDDSPTPDQVLKDKPNVPDAAAPDAAAPDAAAPDAAAPDAKKDDTCYQECLKSNQARAVAWEQVESDCKASCDGTAPKLELKKSE